MRHFDFSHGFLLLVFFIWVILHNERVRFLLTNITVDKVMSFCDLNPINHLRRSNDLATLLLFRDERGILIFLNALLFHNISLPCLSNSGWCHLLSCCDRFFSFRIGGSFGNVACLCNRHRWWSCCGHRCLWSLLLSHDGRSVCWLALINNLTIPRVSSCRRCGCCGSSTQLPRHRSIVLLPTSAAAYAILFLHLRGSLFWSCCARH